MWDGYDEQNNSKPYIWVAFFLLLLVMSSIFFLRPSIGGMPSGEMPVSGNTPVVSSLEQQSIGEPLYLGEGASGIWAVRKSATGVYISYLNGYGVELWGESLAVSSPLIASRGPYLVVGHVGEGGDTVVIYHIRGQQLLVRQVPGKIQAISIAETGEAVVAYSSAQTEPLGIKSHLTLMTSLGREMWTVSLSGVEVLSVSQAADSSMVAALGIRMEDAKLKTTAACFDQLGRPLFSQDFDSRPIALVVRDDGKNLSVAAGQSVFSLDTEGKLLWKYDTGADLSRLSYVGMSSNLLFTANRRSLLTFGMQGTVGVLTEGGKLVWQYRTREKIVHVDTTATSTSILIATDRRMHLYAPDGNLRWSLPHSWGDLIRISTMDGRKYVVHNTHSNHLLRGN